MSRRAAVLAWVVPGHEIDRERPYRPDLGELPRWKETEVAHAAVWVWDPRAVHLAAARRHAMGEAAASGWLRWEIYILNDSPDILDRARAKILKKDPKGA